MNTLTDMAREVHSLAWAKGWHSPNEGDDAFVERMCNLLHDEICELHEAWRNNRLRSRCDKADAMLALGIPQLTNLEEELADIIIRVLDNSLKLGIDIQEAVEAKHAYNKTREVRHGGKRS